MSYPGQYSATAPGAYPPVTQNPPPQQYQQSYPPPQNPYPPPPAQGYPQYPPPQNPQYPPPQNQYPSPAQGYPPAQYPPAQPAYAQYPPPAAYPAATAWAPPAAGYAYPAAPAVAVAPVAYAAAPAYTPAVAYAAPAMAVPMGMPAMNFVLQFQGVHLDRKDIFSKSDPFLAIFASRHPGGYRGGYLIARREAHSTKHNKKFGGISGNWVLIHRTETLHNNQNPVWAPFTVNLYSLCGGNFDTVFKIEVWDSDVHTNHDFIGGAVTTMRELQTSKEVRLINRRRIGIYNTSGRLEVIRCSPA